MFTSGSQKKEVEQHLKHYHGVSNETVADVYKHLSLPVALKGSAGPSLHSPQRLQHNMDYLMKCLDPSAHPARVNDFFNGLDIIVADLENGEYVQKPLVLSNTDLLEQQSH